MNMPPAHLKTRMILVYSEAQPYADAWRRQNCSRGYFSRNLEGCYWNYLKDLGLQGGDWVELIFHFSCVWVVIDFCMGGD
jgi:hypothetical protein